jgi:hypothetical protein
MDKSGLYWGVAWGIICVLAIACAFKNSCHWATAAIAGILCALHISEYKRQKTN